MNRFALAAACGLALLSAPTPAAAWAATATAVVLADRPAPKSDRHLFGQFDEHLGTGIYGGVWVGKGSKVPDIDGSRRDVVDALKAIWVPVIRWPGGRFADEYHRREGVGPQVRRKVKITPTGAGSPRITALARTSS